jgi:uncharacterized protein (UPF0276 family)
LTAGSPRAKIGVAYRLELASWIAQRPACVDVLEVTAEHFYRVGESPLRRLAASYPLIVHTSRLSLGTPGPLDRSELEMFGRIVAAADPLWISECLGFRRIGELDLGCANPVSLTAETLAIFVEHGRQIMSQWGKRLLVGNIASHLSIGGDIPEPDFLNRFCDETGAGIVLDLTNLVVNARNHRFEPRAWLGSIKPNRILQVRVGGCSCQDGRWEASHDTRVEDGVWDLLDEVRVKAPAAARILVREGNFPPVANLARELDRLAAPPTDARTKDSTDLPPARL